MNIGFVGVGFMGRHMARNVLNGGHAMKVNPGRGGRADLPRRDVGRQSPRGR